MRGYRIFILFEGTVRNIKTYPDTYGKIILTDVWVWIWKESVVVTCHCTLGTDMKKTNKTI